MTYHLYTFETIKPIQVVTNTCSAKIGIAKNLDHRNADYQQALGPDYAFQFEAAWTGDEKEIRWMEKHVLKHFKVNRCAEIRALSEWIKDTKSCEIVDFVNNVISSKNLNILQLW
jgi:hypothetical protein